VGEQTALLLDLPFISGVKGIECEGDILKIDRTIDEYSERYVMTLPGAVAVHPRAIQPRDAALSMVERAFKKDPIEKICLNDLGISSQGLGESGSPTKLVSMSKIKRKKKCEFINGSPEEQADELVKRIKAGGYIS
jgi:electron transfer flavoprotein beta subunit